MQRVILPLHLFNCPVACLENIRFRNVYSIDYRNVLTCIGNDPCMQRAMDQVSQLCDKYDLTISTNMANVVHQQSTPGKLYNYMYHCEWTKIKLMINSPNLEALSPEQFTLMMRSLPELKKKKQKTKKKKKKKKKKTVWHSEDALQMSGSEIESSLTPS